MYTKCDWEYLEDGRGIPYINIENSCRIIAQYPDTINIKELQDNLKLASAAPDMYEACTEALNVFLAICKTCTSTLPRPCKCKWQYRIDKLLTVIAKAKGKE